MPLIDINSLPAPVKPPQNPLDDFDPNDRDKGAPPWATYCPSRYTQKFKTHRNRGHAINGMRNNSYSGGVLYAFENGKWVERARFQTRDFLPSNCQTCGQSLLVDEEHWDYQQRKRVKTGRKVVEAHQEFERDPSGKIKSPENVLVLCGGCRKGLGY